MLTALHHLDQRFDHKKWLVTFGGEALAHGLRSQVKNLIVTVTFSAALMIGLANRFRHLQGLNEAGRHLFQGHRLHAILSVADYRHNREPADDLREHMDEFTPLGKDQRRAKNRPLKIAVTNKLLSLPLGTVIACIAVL